MRRQLTSRSIAVLVVALSACGSLRGEVTLVGEDGASYRIDPPSTDQNPTGAIAVNAATTRAGALPTVEIAHDSAEPTAFGFTALLVDGGTIDGASLYAGAPMVITFVQTTCPISDDERPNLAEAARRHPEVTFVVAHSGGTIDDYVDTIIESGLDGRNVINIDDTDLALWNRFGVTASPSNVLVDVDGLLRSAKGALGDDGLDRAVSAVVDGF